MSGLQNRLYCTYVSPQVKLHTLEEECTNLFRQLPDLLKYGLHWSAPLSASCEGDNAETAHVLASSHYGTEWEPTHE